MDDFRDSLDRIKSICSTIVAQFESSEVAESIKALQEAANQAAKSWSGSWLGYHSRVYYNQLQPVPPGARFSQEWGLQNRFSNDTKGEWCEYDFDSLYKTLKSNTASLSLEQLNELANYAKEEISDLREELISIIFSCLASGEDAYLDRLKKEVEQCQTSSVQQFVDYLRPKQFFSLDMLAFQSGLQTPPHIYLQAQLLSVQSPVTVAESLKKIANRLALHLTNKSRIYMYSSQPGTHVFIPLLSLSEISK
ncbi:hypothetical protein [Nostoc sp. TCL240-02]|uniref:hypothetical protein n=1 Tax=Nostoc sp. TCL240-02 TaxID=2572090 RepID=UPI00157F903A|nr:hypothetical protein [Nostoc sp. TCL240-02]QKQ74253.1 hypothetical protein FBB35_13840 [Nostoc sp. TCL240-02]